MKVGCTPSNREPTLGVNLLFHMMKNNLWFHNRWRISNFHVGLLHAIKIVCDNSSGTKGFIHTRFYSNRVDLPSELHSNKITLLLSI